MVIKIMITILEMSKLLVEKSLFSLTMFNCVYICVTTKNN